MNSDVNDSNLYSNSKILNQIKYEHVSIRLEFGSIPPLLGGLPESPRPFLNARGTMALVWLPWRDTEVAA